MTGGPIGAHVSIAGGLSNAIENAVKIDAGCIQIFSSSPGQWNGPKHSEELINKFIDQSRKYEINPIYIHAKYLINLVSPHPQLVERSVRSLVDDLRFSYSIKASGVIVHLGSHQGRGYDAVKKLLVDKLHEVIARTPRQTRLIIENSAGQKGKLSSTIEEIADLFEAASHSTSSSLSDLGVEDLSSWPKGRKRLALCLDTCHLFAAGYDVREKSVVDSLVHELHATRLLSRLVAIHVNDAKDPLGSHRDRHENLGKGQIGVDGLRKFLAHEVFRSLPKIIETPGFDQKGPDQNNIQILRELASKGRTL